MSLSNIKFYLTETTAFSSVKTSFWHFGSGTFLFQEYFCILLYFPGGSVASHCVLRVGGKKHNPELTLDFPKHEAFWFCSASHPFLPLPAPTLDVTAEGADHTNTMWRVSMVEMMFIHMTEGAEIVFMYASLQWCPLIWYHTCRYIRTVQAMIFNVLFFPGQAVSGILLSVSNAYDKNASLHDVVLFYFTWEAIRRQTLLWLL